MARLIGTAGHVDHGKTTLIRALTGIDADRLPEEKKRGMTIDIGFAYIDLPTIGRVSIVDVPGHEKFIHNMLVGALGVDVVLLCVAADEGVKPQTREHFDIVRLLPAQRMVVALTRSDLADADTRELARMDVLSLLKGSRFEGSHIVDVSAITGEGLDDLRASLTEGLEAPGGRGLPSAGDHADPWYLPIDRVFPVKGHGVVVTGTLARGSVAAGERAVLEPGHWEVRVRGIQRHDESTEAAELGSRVALNLAGVKLEDIHRGMAVGAPGSLFETWIIDAAMEWLVTPKHNQRIRVSIGAEEAIGKVFLSKSNKSGDSSELGIVQFRLETPVAVALGQPLIVRRYSPMELMGGGRVLVPQAKVRRRSEDVMVAAGGSDEEAILNALGENPNGVPTDEICRLLGKTSQTLGPVFEKLINEKRLEGFAGLWFSHRGFAAGRQKFEMALNELHQANPRIALVAREKVVHLAKLTWAGKPLDRILAHLAQLDSIAVEGTTVKAAGFKVELTEKQAVFLARTKEALIASGVNVPHLSDLARVIPAPVQAVEEILRLGMEAGEIVRIGDGLFYAREQIDHLIAELRESFAGKPFAASDFRDRFGTSRKYTIPLLEYFDSKRVTLRQGDLRNVS